MEVFVRKSREQFLEFSTLWIDFIAKHFTDCEETKDCKIFLDSVVQNSDDKLTEQIKMWRDNMLQPLKKTKYAKAIERITHKPAVIYHALCYKDITALRENMHSNIVQRVDLFGKYNDDRLTEDDRASMWKFLQKISVAAFESLEETPPPVPTRVSFDQRSCRRAGGREGRLE